MSKIPDWHTKIRSDGSYEALTERAKKNGWNGYSVANILRQAKSESDFWLRAKKLEHKKPDKYQREWESDFRNCQRFKDFCTTATANGWNLQEVGALFRGVKSEEDFWIKAERLRGPKSQKIEQLPWNKKVIISARFEELKQAAVRNGYTRRQPGAVLAHCASEDEFWERAKVFETKKPKESESWKTKIRHPKRWKVLLDKFRKQGISPRALGADLKLAKNRQDFYERIERRLESIVVGWQKDFKDSEKYSQAIKLACQVTNLRGAKTLCTQTLKTAKNPEDFWTSIEDYVSSRKSQPQKAPRPAWEDEIENSPEFKELLKTAVENGFETKNVRLALKGAKSPEFFWERAERFNSPPVEKKERDRNWQDDLRLTREYKELLREAITNGFTERCLISSLYQASAPEKFWVLSDRYRSKRSARRPQPKWVAEIKKSERFTSSLGKWTALNWSPRAIMVTLSKAANPEDFWRKSLAWDKPNPKAFLATWDGSMEAMFGFIHELGYQPPQEPCLISELIDSIIDWLLSLSRIHRPLAKAIQSDSFMDQVIQRDQQMTAAVA